MFVFSSKTIVNKEYKVSDFLKQINASKEVKADAKIVKKVFFQNVLSSDTLNVEEDEKYKLIYIIKMVVSDEKIPYLFIEAIDKNINFHTYFLIEYEDKIASLISFKEIGKSIKIDKYYEHGFEIDKPIELENIHSVADVYKVLLSYEVGIKSRRVEKPIDFITRVRTINKLKFQISKTENGIIYETQPKKKFEYNERLRKYKSEYERLTNMEEEE